MDLFIYIFIILVTTYLLINRKNMIKTDFYILIIGISLLTYTVIYKKYKIEKYENQYSEYSLEEDLKNILPLTDIYLSVFNSKSISSETNRKWFNLNTGNSKTKEFIFDQTPTFRKQDGINLGTNRLIGPFTSDLGIQLNNKFTIFLVCRHGEFVPSFREIELLKLYANSGDNNGLAFYIRANTIKNEDNLQKAQLALKYTDSFDILNCVLNSNDTSIPFDKINLSYYFIVKEDAKIRVLHLIGGSPIINTIGVLNIPETDATFSNKEIVINRFQNWKANLYSFGIIDSAIADSDVSKIYNHIQSNFIKNNSKEFQDLAKSYNDAINALKNTSKCPYDTNVCNSCKTITSWNDITQVLSAPNECKQEINKFCKSNPKHPLCKCWDSENSESKNTSCKLYKSIFDNEKLIETIDQDTLNSLKDKYKLMYATDCPKPKITAEVIKDVDNKYIDYDYNRLKIDNISDNVNSIFKFSSNDINESMNKYRTPINVLKNPYEDEVLKKMSEEDYKKFLEKYKQNTNQIFDDNKKISESNYSSSINSTNPVLNKLFGYFLP